MCNFDGSLSAEELLSKCKQGGPMQIPDGDTAGSTLMSLQEDGLGHLQYELSQRKRTKSNNSQ